MQIGAQSYTVRAFTQTEQDFAASMRRIAAIGYRTVQLSAIGKIPAHTLRQICDDHNLRIVLTHTPQDDVVNHPEEVIRHHEILGCQYIGIGSMQDKYKEAGGIELFAADYTRPATLMRDAGYRFMYHNHAFEWTRQTDGRLMLDALLEAMPVDLMGITLDLYWLQYAGANVNEWLAKLQDRIPCVHLKDMAVQGHQQLMAPVGEGNMGYRSILAQLKALGKTEYALVEQDDCYGRDPFDCLQFSFDFLQRIQ